MPGMAELAREAVKAVDQEDFRFYSVLRSELEMHYAGHHRELECLLAEAGLGEALQRQAVRLQLQLAAVEFRIELAGQRLGQFRTSRARRADQARINQLFERRNRLLDQVKLYSRAALRYKPTPAEAFVLPILVDGVLIRVIGAPRMPPASAYAKLSARSQRAAAHW